MNRLRPVITAIFLTGATAVAAEWQPLPDKAPEPANNPSSAAKVELGKMLYHDPRLSSSGTVACASCHSVMSGGEDNRPNSVGVRAQTGGRSAPTVWNSAFNSVQFWDGRAASLEAQAKGPVTNPIEMGMKSWDDVVRRLSEIPGYVKAFEAAFGSNSPISADHAAMAIAAYERTLITPNSAYDKFAKGDSNALTGQQQSGLKTFGEVGCASCHSSPAFNGPSLPEGTGFFQKFPMHSNGYFEAQYKFSKDLGRAEVTKKAEDEHLFKVPTLRNVALTAPYFHNGSVKTLDEAVRIMGKLQLEKDLSAEQIADIVAFLSALTGEFPKQDMPRLPATPGKTFVYE